MWIKNTSDLSDSCRVITTPSTSHLLVAGEQVALGDAGSLLFSDKLLKGISESFEEPPESLIVFLHDSSFSSVCGLVSLRNNFDELVCYGSPKLQEILETEEYQAECFDFYSKGTEALGIKKSYSLEDFKEAIKVDVALEENEEINLGDGVSIKAVLSPGYREECVSYLVSPDKVLSAGKALGSFHGRDKVSSCHTVAYETYINTLEALSNLDFSIVVSSHSGAVSGDLCEKYVSGVKFEAERINNFLMTMKEEGRLKDEAVGALLAEWNALGVSPEGPFNLQLNDSATKMVEACFATK